MSDTIQAVQLNAANWFIEEQHKTEDAINHIRKILGTYAAKENLTVQYLEGYLSGVRVMYRILEERG